MKSINQIFTAVLLFITGCACTHAVQAADSKKCVQVKRGIISYTLHIGKDIITADTLLTDDSYVYTDKESSMAIADPKEKFHIGVVKAGAFTSERISQNTTKDTYTLANYLVYDDKTKTMEAIPFENGSVTIKASHTGSYIVNFKYTLQEASSGKLITLEGEARFNTESIALQ